MLAKTRTTSPLRRISILTAICTASLAFAATASAQPVQPPKEKAARSKELASPLHTMTAR